MVSRKELKALAIDLDDEWQASGGLQFWDEAEKRNFISRAADLAEMVLEFLADIETPKKETKNATRRIRNES